MITCTRRTRSSISLIFIAGLSLFACSLRSWALLEIQSQKLFTAEIAERAEKALTAKNARKSAKVAEKSHLRLGDLCGQRLLILRHSVFPRTKNFSLSISAGTAT